MPNLGQKLGPLPLWAWGGLAAVAVWFVFLRGRGTSAPSGTSTASGTSPSGQATTDYSLGYAQGVQAAGPGASPASQVASGIRAIVTGTGSLSLSGGKSGTTAARNAPTVNAQTVTSLPVGTQLTIDPTGIPDPAGASWGQWYQITSGPGSGAYVWGQDITQNPNTTGVGGPARRSIGSRSSNLWSDAHPLIGAPVPIAHWTRAVGGGSNHMNEVWRVSTQAGVHPARILALNARPTGLIRVA